MEELISAEEVRTKQDKFLQETIDDELSSIMKRIKEKICSSKAYITVNDLQEHNKKKLIDLGYEVTEYQGDLIYPNYYMISWK